MKAKLLKKIRKRYQIIQYDLKGVKALDYKLKRVPYWKTFEDFMHEAMKEGGFGFASFVKWVDRKIQRSQRGYYFKLKEKYEQLIKE
jgi:hypothetical protein